MHNSVDVLKHQLWKIEGDKRYAIDQRDRLARDRSMAGLLAFNQNEALINRLIYECRDLKERLREFSVRDEDMREPSVVDIIWEKRDG